MEYDVEKMTILWNGRVITGYSEDSKIKVARNEDSVMPKTGIQGETVYAHNANRSGTVVFQLFSSSASLAQLRQDAQNKVKAPCTVRNANSDGGFTVSHNECMITKVPEFSAGKETDSVEISIYIPLMVFA